MGVIIWFQVKANSKVSKMPIVLYRPPFEKTDFMQVICQEDQQKLHAPYRFFSYGRSFFLNCSYISCSVYSITCPASSVAKLPYSSSNSFSSSAGILTLRLSKIVLNFFFVSSITISSTFYCVNPHSCIRLFWPRNGSGW